MADMLSLKGKTALVTGSNRGIGKALALALAEYGAEVIVHCASGVERAQQVADEISARYGTKTHAIALDLAQDDAGARLFDLAARFVAQVDILILNASVQVRRPWAEISPEEYAWQMAVNFRASLQSVQRFLPGMIERQWGRILTVGSVQQVRPHPDMVVYAASKEAQMSMVRNLAKQVAALGVTVNNLAPGVIDTDRNAEALADENYKQIVLSKIPARIVGHVEDCAGAALLLCSDAGRYITGINLIVDGGMHL